MQKGVVLVFGETVRIQSAEYIEHGWYIDIVKEKILLCEIPYGGGQPILIGEFLTVLDAINEANKLL